MPEEPFRFFRPSKLSRRHFARKSFRLLCRTSNREAINRDWKTFLRPGWEPHPCRPPLSSIRLRARRVKRNLHLTSRDYSTAKRKILLGQNVEFSFVSPSFH